MAASMDHDNVENDPFYSCVSHMLSNWTALKYAVQMGQGGVDSALKAEWMVGVVHNFFLENDDLYPEEVEEFVADILNAEFDTIAEDGSLVEISQRLCRFFKLYKENNCEELLEFVRICSLKQQTRMSSSDELKSSMKNSQSSNEEQSSNLPLETNLNKLSLNAETKSEQREENGGSATSSIDIDACEDDSDGAGRWQTITRGRPR